MTISELGSLGEFIGSITVLMTLVYVAVQVRLARSENLRSALVDRGSALRANMAMVTGDTTLAEGVMKATVAHGSTFPLPLPQLLDSGLSELEAFKVQMYYSALLHLYMTEHEVIGEGQRSMHDGGIAMNFASGIGRLIWDEYAAIPYRRLSPRFANHVSELIKAHEDEARADPQR